MKDFQDILLFSEGQSTYTHSCGAEETVLLAIVHHAQVTFDIDLSQNHGRLKFFCIAFSRDQDLVSLDVRVRMSASHTFADVVLFSIAGDDAKLEVTGGITISEGVQGVEGYLQEEQLVFGDRVHIKALPLLEVKSHDVKASHGSKIERLDEEKLFYMMAKGLDQKNAQFLVLEGTLRRLFAQVTSWDEDKKESMIQEVFRRVIG